MSSARRRSSPGYGDAPSAAGTTVPSSSTSSSTSSSAATATAISRSRRSASSTSPSSSSSTSSKKRRYHEIVNRCRNPFCGAVLENKKQRYCDGVSLCQLHRGVMLSFAWPNAPQDSSGDHDSGNDSHRNDGEVAMERHTSTSGFNTAPRRSPTHAVAPQARDGSGAEKRQRGWDVSPPPAPAPSPLASASTTRIAMDQSEHDSHKRIKLTTAPTSSSTTVQQLKSMPLDVMALHGSGSWNSSGGGGGRYVQSGNRVITSSSSITAASSSNTTAGTAPVAPSRMPAPSATATATTMAAEEKSRGLLETPVAPPPSRGLLRANSLPVTTTNRNRDPRVRVTPGASIGNAGSGGAGGGTGPVDMTGGVKRISPADYFNRLRHTTETDPGTATTQETLLSAHRNHRSLVKESPVASETTTTSRSSFTGTSSSGGGAAAAVGGDVDGPSHQPLRRAQSDTTVPTSTSTSSSTASDPRKHSDRSSPSSSYASRSSRDDRSSHHHAHDRPPLVRTSSSTSTASSSTTRRAETSHRNNSNTNSTSSTSTTTSPIISRAERLFSSLLQPKFTYHDCLIKLVLTRVASFVPRTLSALRTPTTTTAPPRTLEFYRELCRLVEHDCGSKLKIVVDENGGDSSLSSNSSGARVTIAGREWLVVPAATSSFSYSSSTAAKSMDLYHEILEKLLTESELWNELITQIKKIHENEAIYRNRGAIGGVTFLKLWSSVKKRQLHHAMDVDLQSSFSSTRKRSHWIFAVGNVEIGSGSAGDKIDAFKQATASAFTFLHGMTILDDAEKPKVAATHVDKATLTSTSSSTSSGTSRSKSSPRTSGDVSSSSRSRRDNSSTTSATSESRHGVASSLTSSSALRSAAAAGAASPRTSHGSSERASSRSTTASSASATASSGTVTAQHHGRSISDGAQDKGKTPSRSATIPSATPAPTPVPMAVPLPLPLSMRRAAVPAPVSIPPPVAAQTRPVATVPVPVQVPVASPSCRFCAGMQAKKPGAKCLKCLRAPPSAASASASGSASISTASAGTTRGPAGVATATGVSAKTLLNSTATPAAASSASSSANRTIAALHSFLRQSGSAALAAPTATPASSSTTANGSHSTATTSRTSGQPQPPSKR